ncbi:MAG: energy transducer TonB [Candidatus Acidiferrales bacterium]
MSDSTPTPQVIAREIPVTIQGSQIVAGTDRRELFTETLKTTLIFDNGAAINLKARVAPGQSLFLRNELSGREILCRVVEVPPPGQAGSTDLEFTIHDPDFWNAAGDRPANVGEETGAQESAPPAPESATATPIVQSGAESSAPADTAVPVATAVAIAETSPGPAFSPAPAELEPLSQPAPVAEVDDAKDAEQLAGILARYAKSIAKRASAKHAENEAQQKAAANATLHGDAAPGVTPNARAFSTLAFRLHGIRELTVRKNPIALAIIACLVIGAALGVSWDVTRMLYPQSSLPLAAIARQKLPALHVKASPSKIGPSKTASAKANKTEAAPAPPVPKIQPPAAAQVPAVRIAKTPAVMVVKVVPTRSAKEVENPAAPVVFRMEPGPDALGSDQTPVGDAKPRRGELSPEMVPARILSQYQPPLPKWAKDLDLGGVVKLDAVIDEKGDLRQMKLVSGPRVLESSAEAAVGLWIFQPALKGGKPIAGHMILTVEFQR